jgi:hypothetical protein
MKTSTIFIPNPLDEYTSTVPDNLKKIIAKYKWSLVYRNSMPYIKIKIPQTEVLKFKLKHSDLLFEEKTY